MLSKYERWYWSFIDKFEARGWSKNSSPGYCEGHHIYPKGLFGKKDNKFRVWVSPREHYVLHLLLSKFTPLPMPLFWSDYSSKEFSPARSLKAKSMMGEKHPLYGIGHTPEMKERMKNDPRVRSVEGKVGINNGVEYKFISPEEEIPEGWVRGRGPDSEETKKKKSEVDPEKRAVNKGRRLSPEWRENLKKAAQNKTTLECPICGKFFRGEGGLATHIKFKHKLKDS